ncbi:hypothetical protein GGE65_007724 [Skermanella aerolata]|uniref:hypothetical protein n=1 Tax=Skermanella aerolata TaxID=393310 RepID=UPI003D1D706F
MTDTNTSASTDAAPQDNGPISIDDAMGLLSGSEPKPSDDVDPADDGAVEQDTDTSHEEDEDSEGDATLDGDADEEEDEGDVEPDQPAIDPPASWSREEKEAFASLPPEVQSTLARRESERDRAFQTKAQQLAEDRKAADARIQAMQAQYEQALSYLSEGMAAEAEPDWAQLARDDPFGWIEKKGEWDQRQKKEAALRVEQERINAHRQAKAAEEFQTYRSQQAEKLTEFIPEYRDRKTVERERDGLVKHATETLGYTQDELAAVLWDARAVKVLRDSYLLAQAKSVRAKATPSAQSVQRPSSVRPDRAAAKVESIAKRFERSGSIEDALVLYSTARSSRR